MRNNDPFKIADRRFLKQLRESDAEPAALGPARTCSKCGHIETKGAQKCAGCGCTEFTHYDPLRNDSARQEAYAGYGPKQPADVQRKKGECQKCGSEVEDPDESTYCTNCEKYLGLD